MGLVVFAGNGSETSIGSITLPSTQVGEWMTLVSLAPLEGMQSGRRMNTSDL